MLKVLRIHRDDAYAWRYMPELLRRMHDFCAEVDAETEPEALVDCVRGWFCAGDWRLGLWAGIEDDQVVAHAFATPEPIGADVVRYVLIRQAKVDRGTRAVEEAVQVFGDVVQWARQLGLKKIMMLTHRDEAAFLRRWGFRPYKAYMKYEIS